VLDSVEDPTTWGTDSHCRRCGRRGVIIPERRAAGLTGTAVKASAGASEHLPIARVTNISRTLDELKETQRLDSGARRTRHPELRPGGLHMPCAIVLGAEGKGLHDLGAQALRFSGLHPMLGQVPSLNVSVAGGVVMYELVASAALLKTPEGQIRQMKRLPLLLLLALALRCPRAPLTARPSPSRAISLPCR